MSDSPPTHHGTGSSTPNESSRGTRRTFASIIGILLLVLVVGTVFVVRAALQQPQRANGASVPAELVQRQKLIEGAQSAMAAREYGRAVAILERLVEDEPFDANLRITHARALVGLGRFEEAYQAFEAAIALEADGPDVQFEAGTVANKAGLIDRAEEHYSMAQAADPTEPRYPLYLAMIQIRRTELDAAMANLVRATRLDPDLAEAWGTMAEIELERNNLGLAAQHLDEARRLQPDLDKWKIAQAKILKRKGEAEAAATILLQIDPSLQQTKPILALLGQCYGMLQRPADAAQKYAAAFAASPEDAELAYEAALWYQRAGDKEQMRRMAQAADLLGHPDAGDLLGR